MKNTSLALLLFLTSLSLLSGCSLVDYYYSKLTLLDDDKIVNNFRHMDHVFRAQTMSASERPLVLEKSEIPIAATYTFQDQQYNLDEFLERSHTTGFLVIHNGAIIHERYFHGYQPNDKATSFSVAKSFVATLVGIALDEGRIKSLTDPITYYVPELSGSGFAGTPIVDLLQMSSGIDFSEDYYDKSTDAYTIFDDMFLWLQPINEVINQYGKRNDAGKEFYYASINTQALGMLVANVFGKPLSQVMEEKLWHPMGANDDAYWLTDQHDNEIAFWGLNATLRDYAKLGLLYLNDGHLNGNQILSKDWVQLSRYPDRDYLKPGQVDGDWGYQYHWWIPKNSQSDFSAIGIYGQFIYVNPEASLVVVKTSADADFKPHEYEAISAFRAIASELNEQTLK